MQTISHFHPWNHPFSTVSADETDSIIIAISAVFTTLLGVIMITAAVFASISMILNIRKWQYGYCSVMHPKIVLFCLHISQTQAYSHCNPKYHCNI